VANSGVITALDGAASQYVRGDGTLADFPTSTGGGSSVSYYLNSSVSQGTIGGVAYRELSKEPIIGAGTDIAISTTGYVASYITDVNDPDVILIPGGNFNCEFYFSVNNNTGNPYTYAELYKYDGTTFTLLGSSVAVPEYITQGTVINPYYFAIPVATANLALTDRLAIRIYVNVDGRTVTLHTENGHLCQVVTTLSKGMVSLNNLTDQSQFLTTGTSGTNFAIVSSGDTHTFNLPIASATNTGKLSSTDWSVFNSKQNAITLTTTGTSGAATLVGATLNIPQYQGVLTNPVTGTGTTNTLPKFTGTSAIGNSNITDTGSLITLGSNTNISSGALGIGSSSLTGYSLRLSKNITGSTASFAVRNEGVVLSDVTSDAIGFRNDSNTAAASFTLVNYWHFWARQGSIGAGSAITNQYGYVVDSNMIGATNNYAFQGNIPSGANRWNLYMAGTASNYMLGNTGIGILPSYKLDVQDANVAGIANVSSFSVIGNGGAGRGVGILIGAGGSSSSVQVARLVGYQETASATANNASFAIQVANSSGTLTEYLRINNAGALGIGTTSLAGYNLRVNKTITGSTSGIGIQSAGAIQSDVSDASYFSSGASTQAATFTLTDVAHFIANQGTIGAGSTITKQYGFRVAGSLIGATNNYAFFSDIASGTNRWNLYMNGTAANYMAGALGIGTTTLTNTNVNIGRAITGSTTSVAVNQSGVVQSDVTTTAYGFLNASATVAAAFSLGSYFHFTADQSTIGAGSSITSQIGFNVTSSLIGATNNFGFRGAIPNGTNRWNLYMDGTANNYLAGNLGIGSTIIDTTMLRISRSFTSTLTASIFLDSQASSTNASASYIATSANTQAATFTTQIRHINIQQGTFGAGSTVTNQFGVIVGASMVGGTSNFGFFGDIPSGTGRWNLYMNGTAANYMAGNLLLGTTTDAGFRLDVNGTGRFSNNLFVEDNKIFGLRPSTAEYSIQYRDLDFRLIGSSDSGTQRLFSFGYYTSNNIAGTWNSKATINSYTGAATFSGTITATELNLSTSNGVVGNINSTNANGGYLTWQTSGTTIADIGTAQQIFGSGGNGTFGINARGARDLAFGSNNTERMRITSGGRVNIGNDTTTNSTYVLSINSSTADSHLLISGSAPMVRFGNAVSGSTNTALFGMATAANNYVTGTAAGDFVITSATASSKIWVQAVSAGVYLSAGSTSWTANSDIRLKDINGNISNAVEKLSTLSTIKFSWKDDVSKKENLGLIAQEVKEVFPELIEENSNGILGVRYTELVPVLIAAIKELKQELEIIKKELK
jgi:hypothetical protein